MRKFLLKICYLIFPLLLFLFYLEYNLNKIPNSYNYKRECLETQLDSIEVLVLGSSQATYGINPEYFCLKGFNLSNVSQPLYYDTKLTLKYVDKMPKLKYVIINISYFSFGFQLIDGGEQWRDYFYSQFWDIKYPELNLYDLKQYSKIFLYTPKFAISYFQKGFHENLAYGYKQNGYLVIDTTNNSLNISDSLGHRRVMLHDRSYRENRFKENQNYLELLVRELKKRNINTIIITPPVLSSYYKYVNNAKYKKNINVINSICTKYKCNYYNFFTDSRFIKRDFRDNDHLNFIGATKFSKILNNEVLKCN